MANASISAGGDYVHDGMAADWKLPPPFFVQGDPLASRQILASVHHLLASPAIGLGVGLRNQARPTGRERMDLSNSWKPHQPQRFSVVACQRR